MKRKWLGVIILCFVLFLTRAEAAPVDVVSLRTQLLNYLTDLPKQPNHKVLSGHEIGESVRPDNKFSARSGYTKYIEGLRIVTGKVIALVGAGYIEYGPATPSIANMLDVNAFMKYHWNRGGLITLGFGPHNPWTGGQQNDNNRKGHNLTDAVTAGTSANASLLKQLDDVAVALADLQDSGVVVLWRPWHEFNGNWFWWGAVPDGQDYINLWRYTHDYLTKTKKLNNLLWVFSASRESGPWAQPIEKYYPGDSYVDIVGLDMYSDTIDQPAINAYRTLSSHGKPFVLAEFGPDTNSTAKTGTYNYARLISQIRLVMPNVSYFMCWSDYTGPAGNEFWSLLSNQNAAQLLSDPWVVNAGEVPTFGRTLDGKQTFPQ